jgi:hypothetical protein
MSDASQKPTNGQVGATKKAREGRSPAFPYVGLGDALTRAEQFRVAEGKHPVPIDSAIKAWGIGGESSAGRRVVAALGHFGLFSYEGSGDQRKVRLSELALNILLDKQSVSPERDQLIKEAALSPPIHKELWDKWGHELPSDATIETYLVRDRGFSSSGALDFMQEYKDTLGFARLGKSDNMSSVVKHSDLLLLPKQDVKIGDFVRWESEGVLRFDRPRRVRAVQVHAEENWAFVEGSETGIPMNQLTVVEAAKAPTVTPNMPPSLPEIDPARLSATEHEWLKGPLSKSVAYRLIVTGELGPREIGKLIKVLQTQQAILTDEDGDETAE